MSDGIKFNFDTIFTWKLFIDRLIIFIDQYRRLADSYISDFFTEDLWPLLAGRWEDSLEMMSFSELSNFANINSKLELRKVLPLSLLAYRATCSSFSLKREADNDDFCFRKYFEESNNRKLDTSIGTSHGWDEFKSYTKKKNTSDLHHVFRIHLKPKKQHEVSRLSHIASLAIQFTDAKAVLDVGSGQGHLARRMAYFHRIHSVCIETEKDLLEGAKKFDLQLERYYKKMEISSDLIRPKHHQCHISQNLSKEQLSMIFEDVFPNTKNNSEGVPFGLVGLHTCGDLGPTLIKTFCSLPDCLALISVACCYMKLSTMQEGSKQ